jgi:hypothetical protein
VQWLVVIGLLLITGLLREQARAVPPGEAGLTPTLAQRAAFGLYAAGTPYYPEKYWALERKVGVQAGVVSGFVDFHYVFGEARDLELSRGGKRALLYSWEPHCVTHEGGPACISFRSVSAGEQDTYFARVAESMRGYPGEIYVRPWAEMNAAWSAWQPGSGRPRAGSLEEFKAAWRHVVQFFRVRGVKNLHFVFSPDASEDVDTVPVAALYPGADYVDVLGIDGYNWGEGGPQGKSRWREFHEVFSDMYQRLTALHPSAPVWICEFGSKEPERDDGTAESPAPVDRAHTKAEWLERALSSRAFPRVEALVFYSAVPQGGRYARDFRVESSRASLRVTRKFARAAGARRLAPDTGAQRVERGAR